MDDLVTFLRAQWDAEERVAQAASAGWRTMPFGRSSETGIYPEALLHAALYGPARVLSEVEAKRQIVTEHYAVQGIYEGRALKVCKRCSDYVDRGEVFRPELAPCRTLRLLALPYAGHRDYRKEWRP